MPNVTSRRDASSPAAAMRDNAVCIVGCGKVGMAAAFALIQSDLIRELVLIGHSDEQTEGEVIDLRHAAAVPMRSPVRIIAGSYADAARCSLVVLTAGAPSGGPDVSRLDLLEKNAVIVREIVGSLREEGFDGVLLMATNPVDVLARIAQEESGLPACRVIGTGTLIDTARLRSLLAERLGVEPGAVDAYIIGEHGDSEIAVWSGARVAGLPLALYPGARDLADYGEMLDDIRNAAPEVVSRKATQLTRSRCASCDLPGGAARRARGAGRLHAHGRAVRARWRLSRHALHCRQGRRGTGDRTRSGRRRTGGLLHLCEEAGS